MKIMPNYQHSYNMVIRAKILSLAVLFSGFSFVQTGCKKLVTVDSPSNGLTSENVYTNDATASAVLISRYAGLGSNSPLRAFSINSISLVSGLSSDELTLYGGTANANTALAQYYLNSLSAGISTSSSSTIWSDFYSNIYAVNLVLERLAVSGSLTPTVKQQLMGEAKFLRAFYYFYLVNLYGDVPLTTTSDYRVDAVLSRSPQVQVYQQIITDLNDAQNLLTGGYVGADAKSSTVERLRPNKWTATALLARAYLYRQQWDSAELAATAVINNTSLYSLCPNLNNVFLKNSTEAIWQIQPVNPGWNTEDARVFILPPTGPTSNSSITGYPVYLSTQLLNSFDSSDQRRVNWLGSVTVNGNTYYYPYKYKSATLNAPVTEYLMVFRLAEQYLIRSEARARQNNIGGATSDLDTIRKRSGLPDISANDQPSLIAAILHERQVELFTEWGNRWLDLKRTGNLDIVMDSVAVDKHTKWNSNWQWYPIPSYEIAQDPHLVQNLDY